MNKVTALQQIATRLRHHVLKMTTTANSGHPTTCFSAAEIISCLFFDEMKYNIKDPNDPGNDEFVLSKGHAAPLLWATYAEARIIPFSSLNKFRTLNSALEGHPTPRMPWIKYATGSLGQGLGIGLGMAISMKIQGLDNKVFVLLGDGECAEGSVFEAAELAAKNKVDNLIAIIDVNRLGQSGESIHGHNLRAWKNKWQAFGWKTYIIDGHDIGMILHTLKRARNAKSPVAIIARTIKGRGVSFLENKEGWHGKVLDKETYIQAIEELGPIPEVDSRYYLNKPRITKKVSFAKQKISKPHYAIDEYVATRKAFGKSLLRIGKNENVVVLDADTKNSTYTEDFIKAYPKRSVECYIAEQNMVSVAQGIAARGLNPVVSTFGAFLTRAHDQIRMAAIAKSNINIVGTHVGVSIGEDGPSQMALEDIAMMRCLIQSTVLYPCDAVSTEKLLEKMYDKKGIKYLRTSRPQTPVIYKNSENFVIGGSKLLLDKGNKIVITAGITVHEALKASKKTKKKFMLVDAYSIKPIDPRIKALCKGKKVIVVEDHYPQGGLAEAVMSLGIIVDKHLCIKKISRSGSKEELMKFHGIDYQSIIKAL